MKEYITRREALIVLEEMEDIESGFAAMYEIPTADVVEVRHGRWIQPHWENSNYCCNCSECGGEAMHRDYQWDKKGIYSLCPHCGAIMDKEEV